MKAGRLVGRFEGRDDGRDEGRDTFVAWEFVDVVWKSEVIRSEITGSSDGTSLFRIRKVAACDFLDSDESPLVWPPKLRRDRKKVVRRGGEMSGYPR